jgi:uroporphyrinogen-III synthase
MKAEGRRKESGSLPLDGKRIVVTRATEQAEALCARLATFGAAPILFPTIQFVFLPTGPLTAAIQQLERYDWLVFTSANAVDFFFSYAGELEERLLLPRLAAVGPATAAKLRARGRTPDVVPDEYIGEALAAALGEPSGQQVLLPRSRKGRPQLVELLQSKGANVDELAIYDTIPARPEPQTLDDIRCGVDVVTFASPSAVEGFLTILDNAQIPHSLLDEVVVACIGPVTARQVEEGGLTATITADNHTTEGLINALVRYYAKRFIPHIQTVS